jgi:Spy/CpxP family protein refolding chaperone
MMVTGRVATESEAPWQNPRILSTLFLVFLAGAASGALSMRLGLHEKLHRTVAAAASREPSRDAVLQRFRQELDLTGDQSQKIALVLDDYRMYYQSLQDQFDDLRSTGRTRILQILNPDQRDKFEKMMNDLAPQLAPSTNSNK